MIQLKICLPDSETGVAVGVGMVIVFVTVTSTQCTHMINILYVSVEFTKKRKD